MDIELPTHAPLAAHRPVHRTRRRFPPAPNDRASIRTRGATSRPTSRARRTNRGLRCCPVPARPWTARRSARHGCPAP
jgi:hypothetical protein